MNTPDADVASHRGPPPGGLTGLGPVDGARCDRHRRRRGALDGAMDPRGGRRPSPRPWSRSPFKSAGGTTDLSLTAKNAGAGAGGSVNRLLARLKIGARLALVAVLALGTALLFSVLRIRDERAATRT